MLGAADDDDEAEAEAAPPTSELEGRTLKFKKVDFNQDQRELHRALEERLNEVGGQYLRPVSLQDRVGANTLRRMLLLSLLGAAIATSKIIGLPNLLQIA